MIPIAPSIVLQLAVALAYLHKTDSPAFRWDIKPEYTLVLDDKQSAAWTDFGISRSTDALGGKTGLTTSNPGRGTLQYMAPEQAIAETPAAASGEMDVFSFAGLTLRVRGCFHVSFSCSNAFEVVGLKWDASFLQYKPRADPAYISTSQGFQQHSMALQPKLNSSDCYSVVGPQFTLETKNVTATLWFSNRRRAAAVSSTDSNSQFLISQPTMVPSTPIVTIDHNASPPVAQPTTVSTRIVLRGTFMISSQVLEDSGALTMPTDAVLSCSESALQPGCFLRNRPINFPDKFIGKTP